ncbi:MAG: hypothetical protein AAFU85_07705 [Planctomycetota bacterium]
MFARFLFVIGCVTAAGFVGFWEADAEDADTQSPLAKGRAFVFRPSMLGQEIDYDKDYLQAVESDFELRPVIFLVVQDDILASARVRYPLPPKPNDVFKLVTSHYAKDEIRSQRNENGTLLRNEKERWAATVLINERNLEILFIPMRG